MSEHRMVVVPSPAQLQRVFPEFFDAENKLMALECGKVGEFVSGAEFHKLSDDETDRRFLIAGRNPSGTDVVVGVQQLMGIM